MRNAMPIGPALCLALMTSCAHTPPNTSGVYAGPPRVEVPDDRGNTQPLAEGQPLNTGQVFALVLELQYPAHAYVIHRHGGVLEGLYPGVGISDAALEPGVVRLPGSDSWMRIPRLDRQSRICVLLSPYPLAPDHRRCPHETAHRARHSSVQQFPLTTSSY
jgi:hypothetical protein